MPRGCSLWGWKRRGCTLLIDLMHFDSWSVSLLGYAVSGGAVAKLTMQVMVVILNYIFSKLLIFRKKGKNT